MWTRERQCTTIHHHQEKSMSAVPVWWYGGVVLQGIAVETSTALEFYREKIYSCRHAQRDGRKPPWALGSPFSLGREWHTMAHWQRAQRTPCVTSGSADPIQDTATCYTLFATRRNVCRHSSRFTGQRLKSSNHSILFSRKKEFTSDIQKLENLNGGKWSSMVELSKIANLNMDRQAG